MNYRHVYLSPHYDDAALSCGGSIYQQVQAGQPVLVVTICAAPPPTAELSAYAQQLHRQWGSASDTVATRRAEDAQALRRLGADGQYLTLHDCIYRSQSPGQTWFYNSDADIFGEVHPADLTLATTIAHLVSGLQSLAQGTTFYAPLAVGHHVDHQLAQAAAWQLRDQGHNLVFYEDYPYADPQYPFTSHGEGNSFDLDQALQAIAVALCPEICLFGEAELAAKTDAVRAYGSQLNTLFGGAAAMEHHLRHYALRVGQQHLAERIWLPL